MPSPPEAQSLHDVNTKDLPLLFEERTDLKITLEVVYEGPNQVQKLIMENINHLVEQLYKEGESTN